MPKPRGREHSTLTQTATLVVRELEKIPGIKMIAPGEIRTSGRGSGRKFVSVNYTTSGMELIISGQSSQKVAVHTHGDPSAVIEALKAAKRLKLIEWRERERKPGV